MKNLPKILVADPISPKGVEALEADGLFEVIVKTGLKEEELKPLLNDCVGLIVRSQTKVTATLLKAAPLLKVVGRAGVGVDNVDVDAATQQGVVVMNAPDGNTISTAEHTFSLLLSVARNIPHAHASMKAGEWDRKKYEGVELYHKTIGILGMGRIGTEVARRALAFGMKVLVYDPYLSATKASALQVELVEKLDELLPRADFITVHMPLTEETRHMIGAEQLALLKPGVRIVNCARGGLIDEEVLAKGIVEGRIAGAALDVFEEEPLPPTTSLRSLPRLVLTPHLGASTAEAQELVGIEIAQSVRATLLHGEIRNAVNMPNLDAKTLAAVGPWISLAGCLGHFLAQIAPRRAEKLELRYSGRIAEQETTAISRAFIAGYLKHFHGAEINSVNVFSFIKNLGLEVLETRQSEAGEFSDLLEVSVQDGERKAVVGGTFFGTQPRIITINGRFIEGRPEGIVLLLENKDCPGIVGHVGSLFGESKINIANMSLSRNEIGGVALVWMNLDSIPEESVMQRLLADENVLSAKIIRIV
ncbi:MAG: phosphoglycerate dehydrogenase [Verrucomicrobia bacterium]|nr:phosphoglycerate dehydrogenase [Verrucomicrobiota bacterium]